MGELIACFLTFRTYGTWLHGDERGSFDRNQRSYGQAPLPTNVAREAWERNLLQHPPVTLSHEQRRQVERAIVGECTRRDWGLIAVNVRTNHVHAVVAARESPDSVMQRLKAASTRELRLAGLIDVSTKLWSRGGSTKYLWRDSQVEAAVTYVLDAQ